MTDKVFTFEAVEDIFGYIATYMKKDDYGNFLSSFIFTWQSADPCNRTILKEVAELIIIKYNLDTHAREYREGTR